MLDDPETQKEGEALAQWELELLDVFVRIFSIFGIQQSIAQIYGILFCDDKPMTQEEVSQRLGISTGSASQGLRFLVQIGAVRRQTIPGQRQGLFVPERSTRRLLGFMLEQQVHPSLTYGQERLEGLMETLPTREARARKRVDSVLQWQRKAARLLPFIQRLAGR